MITDGSTFNSPVSLSQDATSPLPWINKAAKSTSLVESHLLIISSMILSA
jgi:hypothetical protein